MKRNVGAGFTLIELLVVIAIIAILAAILFPVFAQARESARTTACLSNAKQMGLAVVMYAQDYDEAFVPWLNRTGLPRDSARRDTNSWVHLLQPYIKSGNPPRIDNIAPGASIPPDGLFRCPSFSISGFLAANEAPDCDGVGSTGGSWPPRQIYAHYGLSSGGDPIGGCLPSNPLLHPAGSDPIFAQETQTLAQIVQPARTVLVTDAATYLGSNSGAAGAGGMFVWWGCEAANTHHGGGNHVFVEGHAKWLKGNSQRYIEQDTAGCWFSKYYDIDQ